MNLRDIIRQAENRGNILDNSNNDHCYKNILFYDCLCKRKRPKKIKLGDIYNKETNQGYIYTDRYGQPVMKLKKSYEYRTILRTLEKCDAEKFFKQRDSFTTRYIFNPIGEVSVKNYTLRNSSVKDKLYTMDKISIKRK